MHRHPPHRAHQTTALALALAVPPVMALRDGGAKAAYSLPPGRQQTKVEPLGVCSSTTGKDAEIKPLQRQFDEQREANVALEPRLQRPEAALAGRVH